MSIQDNIDFQLINSAFPHIGKQLALLWGYPEFDVFVQRLSQDTRQGARAGFPGDTLFALTRLALAHDQAFPTQSPSRPMAWRDSNFR